MKKPPGLAPSTRFLIDGYNLLHAMGILSGKAGPSGLEKARDRLLESLAEAFGDAAGKLTVVFDASSRKASRKSQAEQEHRGIHVVFSVGRLAADDLIEDLIGSDESPKSLAIVSNDHRLQNAARRRQVLALDCDQFLDILDERATAKPAGPPVPPEREKPAGAVDKQLWLDAFRDLQAELNKRENSAIPAKLPPALPAARKRPS